MKKIVFVFGNPDLEEDSLPLTILPELRKKFPEITFEIKDPNEDWSVPEKLIAIDSVSGIDAVTVFDDLATFTAAPRLTMHDFDALANLRLLQKLGKLKKITIIGVPPMMEEAKAAQAVGDALAGATA